MDRQSAGPYFLRPSCRGVPKAKKRRIRCFAPGSIPHALPRRAKAAPGAFRLCMRRGGRHDKASKAGRVELAGKGFLENCGWALEMSASGEAEAVHPETGARIAFTPGELGEALAEVLDDEAAFNFMLDAASAETGAEILRRVKQQAAIVALWRAAGEPVPAPPLPWLHQNCGAESAEMLC